MTTLDPGASEVLTHGREVMPRRTALRASSPAASITDGLEVLVQLVIAAITTWPWSRSNWGPSPPRTGTRLDGRPLGPCGSGSNQPGAASWLAPSTVPARAAGGSLAGNDSADASSGPAGDSAAGSCPGTISASAARKQR